MLLFPPGHFNFWFMNWLTNCHPSVYFICPTNVYWAFTISQSLVKVLQIEQWTKIETNTCLPGAYILGNWERIKLILINKAYCMLDSNRVVEKRQKGWESGDSIPISMLFPLSTLKCNWNTHVFAYVYTYLPLQVIRGWCHWEPSATQFCAVTLVAITFANINNWDFWTMRNPVK